MTLKSGLVSVTFRNLAIKEIVKIVVEAGLDGIEWGGDIHVPHGDLQVAKQTMRMTEDAGLTVTAYGSYYRFDGELEFVQNDRINQFKEDANVLQQLLIQG